MDLSMLIFKRIKHGDRDKEWQKSLLSSIERAVKNGDTGGQLYIPL